jgi:putative colanic acid biosynthesis acetyltransferase WcaF
MRVDISDYRSSFPLRHKVARALWTAVWALLFRPSPVVMRGWRRLLLRTFGASIGRGADPYPSARVWAPWNLEMGDYSCLSHNVDCYCVDRIRIGANATISQYSFLCTASHDITDPKMGLVTAPISVGEGAWVAADAFIGPGVIIGDGAVVGARSSVFKDVQPWTVVGGNPARVIKHRTLRNQSDTGKETVIDLVREGYVPSENDSQR